MHCLPERTLTAPGNMAADQLMLEAYPDSSIPRFRHYAWRAPSFTFGRTQRWEDAAQRLPIHATWREAHEHFASRFALVRRPTGGGVVDHRDDWTYTLVIPPSHPLARANAGDAYREVHQILAWALQQQSISARLAPCPCDEVATASGAQTLKAASCFERAEPGDVVDDDGVKLAGAAQRRTRDGLLMQGSLVRDPIRAIDWDAFESAFTGALAEWLGGPASPAPFPQWAPDRLAAMIARFESSDWNRKR